MIEALVVNMRRRGPGQMLGMEDLGNTSQVLDRLTGGEYSAIRQQMDRLELALKISIAASVVAGIAGLASLLRGRR